MWIKRESSIQATYECKTIHNPVVLAAAYFAYSVGIYYNKEAAIKQN